MTTKATTCPSPDVLDAFHGRALSLAQQNHIESHIDVCQPCRIALSETIRNLGTSERRPTPPAPLSRYEIKQTVGDGAMGVVYRAWDRKLRRTVALKFLKPTQDAARDILMRERGQREAQALALLSHPNVITVYDVGECDDKLYIAMAWNDGCDLAEWLQSPRPWQDIVTIFIACARGLAAVHKAGLVHRDFKPANVLLDSEGTARISDFGLAGLRSDESRSTEPGVVLDPQLTQTHGILGTPAYMAPEQLRGEAVDERTDQFAVCVALWEALFQHRPFADASAAEHLAAIKAGPRAEGNRHKRIPSRVLRVLRHGLAFRPSDRFPNMTALADALQRSLPRRRWVVPAALALTAGLGVAAFAMYANTHAAPCAIDPNDTRLHDDAASTRKVEAAFASSNLPYAASALQSVRRHNRGFGEAWKDTYSRVCRAQSPAESKRANYACLERVRQRSLAARARFADADSQTVERAHAVLDALPDPQSCLDNPTTETDIATSPKRKNRLVALQARLARFEVDVDAGDSDITAIKSLIEQAGEAEFPHTQANALVVLAQAYTADYNMQDAQSALRTAISISETNQFDHTKARAWADLALATAGASATPERGQQILANADAATKRVGAPPRLAVRVEEARATLAFKTANYADALASFKKSRRAGTLRDQQRREVFIGRCYQFMGRFKDALRVYETVLKKYQDVLGEAHPEVAALYNELFAPLVAMNRLDDARVRLERALAFFEKSYGTDHGTVATVLGNLATVYGISGQPKKSLAALERSIAILERELGEAHPDTAVQYLVLGSTYLSMSQADKAVGPFEKAARAWTRRLGGSHPNVAIAKTAAADAYLQLGDTKLALEFGLAARQIQTIASSAPMHRAQTDYLLVRTWRALGVRDNRVRATAQNALDYFENAPGPNHATIVRDLKRALRGR